MSLRETTTWCSRRCLRSPPRGRPDTRSRPSTGSPLRMGWKSLYEEIKAFKPHVIGCGENHALYTNEALKFFEMCRRPRQRRRPSQAEATSPTWPIGMRRASRHRRHSYRRGRGNLRRVASGAGSGPVDVDGIAFGEGDEVVRTAPRKLIKDLDSSPFPPTTSSRCTCTGGLATCSRPRVRLCITREGARASAAWQAWWTTMADRKVDADGNEVLSPRCEPSRSIA